MSTENRKGKQKNIFSNPAQISFTSCYGYHIYINTLSWRKLKIFMGIHTIDAARFFQKCMQ